MAAARRSVFLRRAARFLTLSLPWLFPIRLSTSPFPGQCQVISLDQEFSQTRRVVQRWRSDPFPAQCAGTTQSPLTRVSISSDWKRCRAANGGPGRDHRRDPVRDPDPGRGRDHRRDGGRGGDRNDDGADDGRGRGPSPPAAALVMPMNPPAPISVTRNPKPLIPVVPVVRSIVIWPISNTDRETRSRWLSARAECPLRAPAANNTMIFFFIFIFSFFSGQSFAGRYFFDALRQQIFNTGGPTRFNRPAPRPSQSGRPRTRRYFQSTSAWPSP